MPKVDWSFQELIETLGRYQVLMPCHSDGSETRGVDGRYGFNDDAISPRQQTCREDT